MRRLFAVVAIAAALGCGSDILGPVHTADGQWLGVQNGYSVSFNLVQNDTIVTGVAEIVGIGGAGSGTASGTFVYPTLSITISIPGALDVHYKGDMSTTQAKIFGKLNGSGFDNLEVDVKKK
jgi:hypothetical protein